MNATDIQAQQWGELYDRICSLLRKCGREDPFAAGDYWVLDENWGSKAQRVEINNLALLLPDTIQSLQKLLEVFPDWKIVVAVDVRGTEKTWPLMGLIIRKDEIIDGLQRQYFPEPFCGFQYEGSRPGTDRD